MLRKIRNKKIKKTKKGNKKNVHWSKNSIQCKKKKKINK